MHLRSAYVFLSTNQIRLQRGTLHLKTRQNTIHQ
jgi:hypothetical protein